MFGLFKAKPPLGPKEKAWTEHRMCWLAEKFGMSRLLETPTLVPNYDGIPAVSNYEEAEKLLDFLRTWMKIQAANVRLQVHGDVVDPASIGSYNDDEDSTIIVIKQEDFEHRDTLVAAMGVGLAKQAIAESGFHKELNTDGGWTVELLPVFLGLGVFPSNATVKDSYFDSGSWSSWSVSRRGNLPSRMFGYALALRSAIRADTSTEWSASLRPDAQIAFEDGMKYLSKTNDSVFSRESEKRPRDRTSIESLMDELDKGSPSRKISAMWELASRAAQTEFQANNKVSDRLFDAIRHKEPDVREAAADTMPYYDRTQHSAQELCDALNDSNSTVRAAAARALGAYVGVEDETVVHDLTNAIKDDSRKVVYAAGQSLSRFGESADSATKMILKRLRRAMVDCSDDEAIMFMWALRAIVGDPREQLNEFFSDADSEYLQDALGILEQLELEPAA